MASLWARTGLPSKYPSLLSATLTLYRDTWNQGVIKHVGGWLSTRRALRHSYLRTTCVLSPRWRRYPREAARPDGGPLDKLRHQSRTRLGPAFSHVSTILPGRSGSAVLDDSISRCTRHFDSGPSFRNFSSTTTAHAEKSVIRRSYRMQP